MKTADEIIQEIGEVLAEADGEFIEKIANQVLSHFVKYAGDSLFDTVVAKYQRPVLDDRGGSPDNSYRCGNCFALFDKGGSYPEDTFCCSHCYHRYHGDECPEEDDCQECEDDPN